MQKSIFQKNKHIISTSIVGLLWNKKKLKAINNSSMNLVNTENE